MTFIDKKSSLDKTAPASMPESRKLADIIRAETCLVLPRDATVREATELMCRYHCGAVGVAGDDEQVIGIVTDRDILKKVISRNRDPRRVKVSDIMIPDPETIDVSSDANAALDMVANSNSRYLPVVENDRLVAILDVRDLYEEVRRILAQEIDQRDMLLSFVFHEPYGGYPHCKHL